LRAMFNIVFLLDLYGIEDLQTICNRSAGILNVAIDEAGAHEIARRGRGTPRIVNRLLRRVRDFAEVDHDGRINEQVAADSLDKLDVDNSGLDNRDVKPLSPIIEKIDG